MEFIPAHAPDREAVLVTAFFERAPATLTLTARIIIGRKRRGSEALIC